MAIELRALGLRDLGAARTLLAAACAHDPAAEVAEEKLFGPAAGRAGPPETFAAFDAPDRPGAGGRGGALLGLSVASGGWLRLLAVDPARRGRGIGTALLAAAESAMAHAGADRARTLDQPGNYLAPGISRDNTDSIGWITRRGYGELRENTNLLIDVRANPRVTPARLDRAAAHATAQGYRIARARAADRTALCAAIADGFSAGWAFEVGQALRLDPPAVHIATDGAGQLAAFAAHDGNNRGLGWFGPAGTFESHRKKGLGEALLLACLLDVAAAGRDTCTVAWIGPRGFYERVAGVASERRFVVLARDLGGDGPRRGAA